MHWRQGSEVLPDAAGGGGTVREALYGRDAQGSGGRGEQGRALFHGQAFKVLCDQHKEVVLCIGGGGGVRLGGVQGVGCGGGVDGGKGGHFRAPFLQPWVDPKCRNVA
jgi:hypothetical protein